MRLYIHFVDKKFLLTNDEMPLASSRDSRVVSYFFYMFL